jgi:hypothetical protein
MHVLELTDDEIHTLREALRSFMDDFDVVRRIQALLENLPSP